MFWLKLNCLPNMHIKTDGRKADRQADKQAGEQAGRQPDRHTDIIACTTLRLTVTLASSICTCVDASWWSGGQTLPMCIPYVCCLEAHVYSRCLFVISAGRGQLCLNILVRETSYLQPCQCRFVRWNIRDTIFFHLFFNCSRC